ncbi:Allophanate hydrolase [Rubrivivax sp. A210]|uniref:allophanate hydrolase n=1 Tax=Rubrivivax sp. A210 TaxID=2772301 RepID=UPI00191B5B6D|nr:allophanate hydrolase [Rubrivivax sp. A210]CAD5369779.1 Allophanate hydrolase [Rubrivivax sp. A210]
MTPTPPSPASTASPAAHAFPTVAGLLAALRAGDDPLPGLQALRRRAQDESPAGVWIHLCPDTAWARQIETLQARLAEAGDRAALLRRYPLLGLPFAVKDNIDIAGEPTTAACPAFSHVAAESASVVRRLLDAGALWLGKTNLDQFATGLVGTRSPYGRPASVADATRVSGGSSSGSAVAVACGLVAFALGTDTAGSGRVPAGFNGLVGLKPTPGRVSTAGVLPACRTLDCVSVFAHGADDAAHVLAVIEGPDAADAYSHFAPGRARLPERLRIAVPRAPRLDTGSGYAEAWPHALGRAADLGHKLVEIDFAPLQEVVALLYEGPWVAERHAAIRSLFEQQPEAMDATVRGVIARALGHSATALFTAQYKLRAMQAALRALWEQADVLMVPTAPGHPTFDAVDADPVGANAVLGTYTNFVNLLGWCALALPAGSTRTGLPFGVTFIAPGGADAALADWGRRWEGADQRPAWLRTPATEAMLPLAVVGAHLSGLPLNGQLRERGATLLQATTTAPAYRLYALPGTTPPKPGLLRVAEGGSAIAVEVWAVPQAAMGSFLALVPAPLGLGSLELADGRSVHGFLCEPHALAGARDITAHGGWRAYLATLAAPKTN